MGINDNAVPASARKKAKEPVADMAYDLWREELTRTLWPQDEQEKTRRGRKVDDHG